MPATRLILQARRWIADGLLGDIRIVNMQFAHGFHAQPVEQENASTRWRVDPRFVGPSYVLATWPPIRCFWSKPWPRS